MKAPEEKFGLQMEKPLMIKRPGEDGQKVLDPWNGDWFMIRDDDPSKPILIREEPITIELLPETQPPVLEKFATKIYLRRVKEKV